MPRKEKAVLNSGVTASLPKAPSILVQVPMNRSSSTGASFNAIYRLLQLQVWRQLFIFFNVCSNRSTALIHRHRSFNCVGSLLRSVL